MRFRRLLGFIAVALAIGGAFVAGLLLGSDETRDRVPSVERPAERGRLPSEAKTVQLTEVERLPPLPRRVREREVAPEPGRRTPIALTADEVESKDFPKTDLQDPNDPRGTDDAYGLFANRLVSRGAAIHIAEPVVASKGSRVFMVWNRGAAFSSDGGKTFTYADPSQQFPAASGGFCCDQVAYYVPGHDLWVWFLQYSIKGGENIVRLALAQGDAAFDARRFRYYDLAPANFPKLGLTRPADFDYPNVGATERHLFLSTNVYTSKGYANTVVMRVPLDDLVAGRAPTFDYMLSRQDTAEFTDGARDTMYFAQHFDSSTLRVWSWPDGAAKPESSDVPHSSLWSTSRDYTCPRLGAAKGDWCARKQDNGKYTNDERPTGGWVSGDTIGFAWNSGRVKDKGFPYPFVMVVRIDRNTMKKKDEPFIWNPKYAYQFAAFSPNGRGDLASVALAGGGERFQTCATLINDSQTNGAWEARAAHPSQGDPDKDKAGDYLAAVPTKPGSNTWHASCMAINDGPPSTQVDVRLLSFGRVKDREG